MLLSEMESDVIGYCRTLYSFAARSATELSFGDNETIAIISKAFGMWWKGRLNDTASIRVHVYCVICYATDEKYNDGYSTGDMWIVKRPMQA